jgi:hypothetical protein
MIPRTSFPLHRLPVHTAATRRVGIGYPGRKASSATRFVFNPGELPFSASQCSPSYRWCLMDEGFFPSPRREEGANQDSQPTSNTRRQMVCLIVFS